jgi:hypothetical protein
MFVFWAAWSLAARCPGRHERVWAVYVASVNFLSPFPPQSRLGFSLCVHLLWALASSPLLVYNQFSHCFFSIYIALHLLSLSTYVFSTSKNLFRAFECGDCGAWVSCFSSAVRKCGTRLQYVSAVHNCVAWVRSEYCAWVRCILQSGAQLWRYFSECCGFRSLLIYYQCLCELVSRPCFLSRLFWV